MKLHLSMLFAFLLVPADLFAQRLTIHHLDVAQGDATLIRTSNGKAILIDAGDTGKVEDVILSFACVASIDEDRLTVCSSNECGVALGDVEMVDGHALRE